MPEKKQRKKATKTNQPKTDPAQTLNAAPPGMVMVSLDWLNDLQKKSNGSAMSDLERDIIKESIKIAKNETSSAYQLVQYAKELISIQRAQQ